jgi:hypothetical protein
MSLASSRLFSLALLASLATGCSPEHVDPVEGLEGRWFVRRRVLEQTVGCPTLQLADLDMVIARSEYTDYTLSIQPTLRVNDPWAESPEMGFTTVEKPFGDDRTIDIEHDLRFDGGGTSGTARAFLSVDGTSCSYGIDVVGYRVAP